jgi:hypothetical protein
MPVTLAPGDLERHAPEPDFIVSIHTIDAPDLAIAVEDVEVIVLPGAAFA